MIVVLAKQASSDQIEAVAGRIRAEGLETRMLYGVEKTVIAVIGHRPPELLQQIQRMPGVETAMPVGAPYKLAAQREGQDRTSITVGGATIGDGSVAVMAGPCTVESREQLLTTAPACRGAGRALPARRRLQAAQLALQLPGDGRRGPAAARGSQGAHRLAP